MLSCETYEKYNLPTNIHNKFSLRQLHKIKIILKQINLFCIVYDLHYLCTYFIEI